MKSQSNVKGVLIASLIIALWILNLIVLFQIKGDSFWLFLIPGILLQTQLYTGLFITAHDAMHGTVSTNKPKLNHAIGIVAVLFYALFSFKKLKYKHQFHHDFPGTEKDPDFHEIDKPRFFNWYFRFLLNYLQWPQLIGMAILFNILHHILQIPLHNLLLFWVLPSILSTFQLFYFGTYLPHRRTELPFPDHHNAHTLNYGKTKSFFTCYHFGGHHHLHHLKPEIPWYNLAKISD